MAAEETYRVQREAIVVDSGTLFYRQRGFWARKRMLITKLSMLCLFIVSWRWDQPDSLRWMIWPGALLVVSGIAIRVWAAGCLRKQETLAMQGPYAFIRHPLYLGTGLAMCGQGLMSCLLPAPFLVALLWFCLYWPVIREEEAYLADRYGGAFARYRALVPAILPRVWPVNDAENQPSGPCRFSWQQVWHNREYEGAIVNIGIIIGYAWMNFA